MNADVVKNKLIVVLQAIQTLSELECPPLSGATKPLEELPKFDSKIWPVAIGMLADELKITIPDDVNIFRVDNSCIALTIDQTVKVVMSLIEGQESLGDKVVNAL